MSKQLRFFAAIFFFTFNQLDGRTTAPTWASDMQCIVYSHCSACHNPNGIAPFSLLSYEDAYLNRYSIRSAVTSGLMPPYLPNTHYQQYTDMRTLSQLELSTIVAWVDSGGIEGDTTHLLPAPNFNAGPVLTSPDITARIPTFTVPNTGADLYQCFVLTGAQAGGSYIKTIEVIPGNNAAVHHVLVYEDTSYRVVALDSAAAGPGYTNFGGTGSASSQLIGGWVPGAGVDSLPPNMGIQLQAGARIVVQIHYPVTAQGLTDSTRVNIQFTNTAPIRNVYVNPVLSYTTNLVNGPLVIPADSTRTFYEKYRVPVDVSVLGIAPHAHLVCQKMQCFAVTPANDTIHLIQIDNWDFHWQGAHYFQKPVKIPANSMLHGWGYYNNTYNNPNGPRPIATVTAGEATTNEMLLFFFWYLQYQPGDENIVIDTLPQPSYLGCVSAWVPDSTTTGIDQTVAGLYTLFYPNPANSRLNYICIQTPQQLAVCDLAGQEMMAVNGPGSRGEIPLAGLSAGTYLLRLKYEDGSTETLRFVKE